MGESIRQLQRRVSILREKERKRLEKSRLKREVFALKHRKLISAAEKVRTGAGRVGSGLRRTGVAIRKAQIRLKESEARQRKRKGPTVQTESMSERINKALGGLWCQKERVRKLPKGFRRS